MRSYGIVVISTVLALCISQPAQAAPKAVTVFNGPAFSASAKTLQQVEVPASVSKGAAVVVLFESASFQIRDSRVVELRYRRVFRVVDESGVESWSGLSTGWAPWYQDKPTMHARVLTPSGQFISLDPATIETPQAKQGDAHTYSDWRSLRAPLPGVHVGSIVETEVVITQRSSLTLGGDRYHHSIGDYVPVLQSRVSIEYPLGGAPTIRTTLLPGAKSKKKRLGKRIREVFDFGASKAFAIEESLPSRLPRVGHVSFSTSRRWKDLAGDYQKRIDKAISAGPLPQGAKSPSGADREATITLALATLQERVRYTGLEFGRNAIVPWSPATSWQRQYGDCKDKATLLIAMLAAHGIKAHLALLNSGYGFDDGKRLPGLSSFDHAIVYVPALGRGAPGLWIDPTVELARPGQLTRSVQGRWALLIREGQNHLVQIPRESAAENVATEYRTIKVSPRGAASLVERSVYQGGEELTARYEYRNSTLEDLKKQFETYIKGYYLGEKIDRVEASSIDDLAKPYEFSIHADSIDSITTQIGYASASINFHHLAAMLPNVLGSYAELSKADREKAKERKKPLAVVPGTKRWIYRFHLPDNLNPTGDLASKKVELGPISFEQHSTHRGNVFTLVLSMTLEASEMSASEVNLSRKALAKLLDDSSMDLRFSNKAMVHLEADRIAQAAHEISRQREADPKNASLAAFEAFILLEAGLGKEARKVAAAAVKLDSRSTLANEIMGIVAMYGDFGRLTNPGFRREESLTALKAAIKLSPDIPFLYSRLGIIQSRDHNGREASVNLKRAISSLQKAHDGGATDADIILGRLLLREERHADLAALIETHKGEMVFDALGLVSLVRNHPKTLSEAARGSSAPTLQTALQVSLSLRDYKTAGLLVPYSQAKNIQGAQLVGNQIVRFRHRPSPKEPMEVVQESLAYLLEADTTGLTKLLSKRARRHGFRGARTLRQGFMNRASEDIREIFHNIVADVFVGIIDFQQAGRAGTLRRFVAKSMGINSHIHAFTVWEGGRHRLLASTYDPAALASEAIALLQRNRPKEAKAAVEWLLEIQRRSGYLSRDLSPATIWHADSLTEKRRIRLVAGLFLLSSKESKLAIAILSDCPVAETNRLSVVCLRARATSLHSSDMSRAASHLDDLAQRWPKHANESRRLKALYLGKAKRWDNLEKVIADGLAKDVEHKPFYQVQKGYLLAGRDQFTQALEHWAQLAADGELPHHMLNNTAWLALFDESKLKAGLSLIERYLYKASNDQKDHGLHTQATLRACSGELAAAKDALHASIQIRSDEKPVASDWLIYGKIAEKLGRTAAAQEAYDLVIQDAKGDTSGWQSGAVAKRWTLQAKSSAPKKTQ